MTELPDFESISTGDQIATNNIQYSVVSIETRSPGPGETVYRLILESEHGERCVLAWNPAHTIEEVHLVPVDGDPVMDGESINSVAYSSLGDTGAE